MIAFAQFVWRHTHTEKARPTHANDHAIVFFSGVHKPRRVRVCMCVVLCREKEGQSGEKGRGGGVCVLLSARLLNSEKRTT